MPERPLLILPQIGPPLPRQKNPIAIKEHFRLPSREERAKRFSAKFESMIESFIGDSPDGISTENVLVLETVGKIEDFKVAARKIPGLEWQAEVDIDDIASDDSYFERPKIGVRFLKKKTELFNSKESEEIQQALVRSHVLDNKGYLREDCSVSDIQSATPDSFKKHSDLIAESILSEKKKPLTGRMYLSLSNRQALEKLKSLYDADQKGKDVPELTGVWKGLFSHLKEIRYWSVEDRVRDTGILEYWKEELEIKKGTASTILFEIELSYSEDSSRRLIRQKSIIHLVKEEGGIVLADCLIPEIRFHALKVELPVNNIERVLKNEYGNLFKSGGIMFFRPSAQCDVKQIPNGIINEIKEIEAPIREPVVALLDGMPFANHVLLNNFLIIDDPDGFSEEYQSNEFRHGTAMASLICHGELDSKHPPMNRKLYVRPILKPDEFSRTKEKIPNNVFFEDLLERSVRRMFEGDGEEPPTAPTVKIINLSVADSNRIFHKVISPAAKLLDWLSYKYSVLFCVSSGNINNGVHWHMGDEIFTELKEQDKISLTLRAIDSEKRNRRLFSPSEAINVISIGALHCDDSQIASLGNRTDILPTKDLPSPISVTGHGFRSAVKPEVFVPGGRQLFYHEGNGMFNISDIAEPPGQKVAAAPVTPGERNRTVYTRGSSNATALSSRYAALIYDALEKLFDEKQEILPESNVASLLKTLLVHSASWGNAADTYHKILNLKGQKRQKEIARFIGYGVPDVNKSMECSLSRATAIGYGTLEKDQRHEYKFPLPPCLSGQNIWRRLTVTLGWLSPIGPENRKYRRAQLSFIPTGLDAQIGGERTEVQWQQVKNGTIQHEIFEGKEVVAFIQGDELVIPIQCKEDAGVLDTSIHYGLAISLEAKESVKIPIYEEVKTGIEILLSEQIEDRIQ